MQHKRFAWVSLLVVCALFCALVPQSAVTGNAATVEIQTTLYLPLVINPGVTVPAAFSKTVPVNGAGDQPSTVTLDWSDSYGATSYSYCFDTSNDHTCSYWIGAGATSQATVSGLRRATTYFWQVRASNDLGVTYADGNAGASWSFTTSPGAVIPAGMALIPAGEFPMGCDPDQNGGYPCWDEDRPLHTVYLDAYLIDKTEVTNAQYAQCVAAGKCFLYDDPESGSSYTRGNYYKNPAYADYPKIYVTWDSARDYCTWARKRLPTEAEWEKAARGTGVRTFPWGDAVPNCNLANYNSCIGDTDRVGSYPSGASPYGVLDMAGNVAEWVQDWFQWDYYTESPFGNPPGPDTGEFRVIRGGDFLSGDNHQRLTARSHAFPYVYTYRLGFRCAAPLR